MDECENLYNKKTKNIDKIIKYFYDRIQKGENVLTNLKAKIEITSKISSLSEYWVPSNISEFISKNKANIFKITATINGKNITLYFYTYDNVDKDTIILYSNYVFLLIYFITNVKTTCSKNIEINIYLTPFTKLLPKNKKILGPNEVNTGYSNYGCLDYTEITIYRKEEWFKVLIHELFHNLNLDFASIDNDYGEKFKKLLGLDIKYNINEAYPEIWARIILVVFASYIESSSYTKYKSLFIEYLNTEISFSLIQANKILNLVNSSKTYKEDTNAYVYYVFTASLLNNYIEFLEWCYKNNNRLFYFNKDNNNLNSFIRLLECSLLNFDFIKKLSYLKIYGKDKETLRMTSIDIF